MLSRPTPIRATTRSRAGWPIAAADTRAQHVTIATGSCAAASRSISAGGAGSAGPATKPNPAPSMIPRSIVSSGHARSVSRTFPDSAGTLCPSCRSVMPIPGRVAGFGGQLLDQRRYPQFDASAQDHLGPAADNAGDGDDLLHHPLEVRV